MDKHALAILSRDNFWNWSNTERIQESGSKLESITHTFLYYLILESQTFGGDVLDLFWTQLANCNRGFRENSESNLAAQSNRLTFVAVERLKEHEFESAEKTSEVLFRGILPENINYDPVLRMATEYFTHLGIVCKTKFLITSNF